METLKQLLKGTTHSLSLSEPNLIFVFYSQTIDYIIHWMIH